MAKSKSGSTLAHRPHGCWCLNGFGLGFGAACMEYRLSVSAGLIDTFENQVTCSGKCNALVKVRRHWCVCRISCILAVDDFSHATHGVHHLALRADAVM